jgi:hypothetical protein
VNVTKAKLETLFSDELARLQPTPGYMRLLKESVLAIWKTRQAPVRADLAQAQRAADAIQQKLDRLNEAFLFQRSIDIETYDRPAERLREELALRRMDRHASGRGTRSGASRARRQACECGDLGAPYQRAT